MLGEKSVGVAVARAARSVSRRRHQGARRGIEKVDGCRAAPCRRPQRELNPARSLSSLARESEPAFFRIHSRQPFECRPRVHAVVGATTRRPRTSR